LSQESPNLTDSECERGFTDGKKFVFDQFDCEGGGLWMMNADGSGKHQLTNNFEDKSDWHESGLIRKRTAVSF